MTVEEKGNNNNWSREQDKAFENAIATYPEDMEDRWVKITSHVPGKTLQEIKDHYELLLDDVNQIESGRVPLPCYDSQEGSSGKNADLESNHGSKTSRSDQERRKGIAWTEDEHRLFLLGLEKYGKGDWRSISRNFVVTRTPTQVASHAQKYFIRLNSMNKDRRRTSIHDITSVNSGDITSPQSQGPITGQSQTNTEKQGAQPPPVSGTLVSAVGTPVNLPHMVYGIRAPVGGSMVPGTPTQLWP